MYFNWENHNLSIAIIRHKVIDLIYSGITALRALSKNSLSLWFIYMKVTCSDFDRLQLALMMYDAELFRLHIVYV